LPLSAIISVNGPVYNGPIDCLKQIIKHEGFFGLYRGMGLPLAGTILETSTLFAANGFFKRQLTESGTIAPGTELPMKYVFIAGAGTGFAVSWLLTPIELVKCRLQVAATNGTQKYRGPFDVLVKSIKNEGLKVLYRGHLGTILRETPGTACWFGAYETFVRAMTPVGAKREDLHPAVIVTAGALGGMAYWSVMYPCDTVKSAMQIIEDPVALNHAESTSSSSSSRKPSSPPFSSLPSQVKSFSESSGAQESATQTNNSNRLFRRIRPIASSQMVLNTGLINGNENPSSNRAFSSSASSSSPHVDSKSFSETFMKIYRAQGIRGLYAGLTPTMIRAAPSNAAIFLVYEWSIKHIKEILEVD
jgi:Mitochondrial carrier protein